MKVLIVFAAVATLLMPVSHGVLRQCAGIGFDNKYEASGFLTADFTQKSCASSGGLIDPNRKGNLKCCNVPDARQGDFNGFCNGQNPGNKFHNFRPSAQSC
ncbi:hypothetical protein GN244_ATG02372 [Phytophthora infestans]|uniref:Uncharacterized protein n=1 Tax=Phytophthora infestans TaxID=4787 RepID=A0A833TEX3_PHYIN|nr:hypothetical protein GN244_ATG02372 [Phytophthora infestans]KAF4149990.1 hypothetical protein GN958_ATG00783 [Phytophthora infestans]KAF4150005.1 hypothetical protein GN958_ATG00798 [Phytophthora infestans]